MHRPVFISYSSQEYKEACRVRDRLESAGVPCWIAPDCIDGGSSYARQIPRAIQDCDVFVLILSNKSMNSIWVAREVDRAINEGKRILPFVLENAEMTDEFKFYLTNVQWYAAFENYDAALQRMTEEILDHVESISEPQTEAQPEPAALTPAPARTPETVPAQGSRQRVKTQKKTVAAPKPRRKKRRWPIILGAAAAMLVLILLIAAAARGGRIGRQITVGSKSYSAKETYLSLDGATLTEQDLENLARLTRLTYLRLENCTVQAPDLHNLLREGQTTLILTNCRLTENQLKTIPLESASLRTLDLSGNSVSSLSMLASMSDQLTSLKISDTGLPLSELSALDHLTELACDRNGITDLGALADHPQLNTLSLNGNHLTDLSALSACEKLTSLCVNDNDLDSLAGLERCIRLEELEATGNHIRTLDGISNATRLRRVLLSDNELEDISVLAKSAEHLTTLNLSGNRLSDVSPLSRMGALMYLYLDDNRITSLVSLKNCKSLKELSANRNLLDGMPLFSPEGLTSLSLAGNRITSCLEQLSPPLSGTSLNLDLTGNPLTHFSISASGRFSRLSLHGTSLTGFDGLYALNGSELFLDYSEKIDFSRLGESWSTIYLYGCPLDRQLDVHQASRYSVEFVEEDPAEADASAPDSPEDASGQSDSPAPTPEP